MSIKRKKQHRWARRWQHIQAHPVKSVLKYVCLILIIIGLVVGGHVGRQYWQELQKDVSAGYLISREISVKNFYPKQPTVIEDRNHHVMKKLTHSQSTYVSHAKLNPRLTKGVVAIEDRRFYEHHGVDLTGVLRGVKSLLLHRQVQGGSTLTQQLVKNVILKDQTQSLDRKVKEMVIAQQLGKKFTKKQILEFYLNDVYLGHGCYGIGSAAQYYFSKNQADLNWGEAALLVGIPNNQVLYDPIVHPKAAQNRRNTVLYSWYQQKMISKKTFNHYADAKISLKIHNFQYDNNISQDYALNYAVHSTVQQLMMAHGFEMKYLFKNDQDKNNYKNHYSQMYDKYYGQLLNGGYIVQTTIDQQLQQQLLQIVQQQYAPYQSRDQDGKLEPQVSSTIVDNRTGNVLAIIGGRTTENDQLNRATDAYRQPGSTAKPLIAYAPAFERGYLPQSKVVDGPVGSVSNWYSGYRGPVTLRNALADSINTVAFKLALEDKQQSFYQDLGKMQFQGLYPEDKNAILAVGGFTKGVTTTEMASAYSSFARQGNFIAPSNVQKIYDTEKSQVLYQNPHTPVNVYAANASYLMLNTMQSVVNNGLGKKAALSNYPYVAGKTGTTDRNMDSYFVGMTPYFTIANWTGYDHQTPLSDAQEQLSIQTFKAEGEHLVDYLKEPKKDFKMPKTVKREGDNLYVRQNVPQKSIAQVIEDNYLAFNSAEINANKNRLDDLDYRLIYHLTKKQEQSREHKVQQTLDKYQAMPFDKLSQHEKKLSALQKIRYKNENVKRMSAKSQFNQQIMQLQRDLNVTQAQLEAQKENQRVAKFEKQKNKIQQQRSAQRKQMVDKLMPQYQRQLSRVKSAYQNDDADKETQKQKLTDLINQIRSYGGKVADPVIVVK
ncbi:transglycosylase domain-containing protein [Bombilactobacillus folatiphilus]|uniref:Transglycosylase domain-containing protein n=1 Tax=Bombilactobacillus folatiphilus TaxID=2923362 RepID=A0ABY4P8X4_9LACO|nr:transglycosylase domain-containing protein [Bombilactobacillus folatiphilus]UQS82112.1 transglycosylase domain-containing protein [Bombilactobacillus folatiphilus]